MRFWLRHIWYICVFFLQKLAHFCSFTFAINIVLINLSRAQNFIYVGRQSALYTTRPSTHTFSIFTIHFWGLTPNNIMFTRVCLLIWIDSVSSVLWSKQFEGRVVLRTSCPEARVPAVEFPWTGMAYSSDRICLDIYIFEVWLLLSPFYHCDMFKLSKYW